MEALQEKQNRQVFFGRAQGRMDFSILLVVTILCAFGLVMIFSASYYYAQHYSRTMTVSIT